MIQMMPSDDSRLADPLRREAQSDRPVFSEVLHARICRAVLQPKMAARPRRLSWRASTRRLAYVAAASALLLAVFSPWLLRRRSDTSPTADYAAAERPVATMADDILLDAPMLPDEAEIPSDYLLTEEELFAGWLVEDAPAPPLGASTATAGRGALTELHDGFWSLAATEVPARQTFSTVWLYYVDDLSVEEIVQALQYDPNDVRMTLSAANIELALVSNGF